MSREPFTADFLWPAPAKLNLFLHITGRRADGYHELQTVFQFLDYGDDLSFAIRDDGLICRSPALPDIPDEQDLTVRAARTLQTATNCSLGADIRLHKRIPLGGGLGGGSSDAATTLLALNQLWGTGLSLDQLATLGLKLGADVPVFVRGVAAWAEGVGESLQPVALPEAWYLVVTPAVAVSTAEIFNAPALQRDCPKVSFSDFTAGRCRNVCEPVTFARYPAVGEAHCALQRFGPARMSGTGSSSFVPLPSRETARQVQDTLPKNWKSFVARGLNQSPLLAIIRARN